MVTVFLRQSTKNGQNILYNDAESINSSLKCSSTGMVPMVCAGYAASPSIMWVMQINKHQASTPHAAAVLGARFTSLSMRLVNRRPMTWHNSVFVDACAQCVTKEKVLAWQQVAKAHSAALHGPLHRRFFYDKCPCLPVCMVAPPGGRTRQGTRERLLSWSQSGGRTQRSSASWPPVCLWMGGRLEVKVAHYFAA